MNDSDPESEANRGELEGAGMFMLGLVALLLFAGTAWGAICSAVRRVFKTK